MIGEKYVLKYSNEIQISQRICTIVNWLCKIVVHSILSDFVNQELHIAHFRESTNRLPLNFTVFLILGPSQMIKSNTHSSHSSHASLAKIKMTTYFD